MTDILATNVLITLGDLLKAEADPKSRDVIVADNVHIGDIVDYGSRKLVALSNSEHGKVLVQPRNCTINLAFVRGDTSVLTKDADAFGIKYITDFVPSAKASVSLSGEGVDSNTVVSDSSGAIGG